MRIFLIYPSIDCPPGINHGLAADLRHKHRDLTTYDATFLWISRALGVPLYTFDDRLRIAANR